MDYKLEVLGYRGAVHCYDEASYVDMPFIHSTEKDVHANRSVQVKQNNLGLADNALTTHSLKYVVTSRLYDTLHFLTNFEYWSKEIQFEQ